MVAAPESGEPNEVPYHVEAPEHVLEPKVMPQETAPKPVVASELVREQEKAPSLVSDPVATSSQVTEAAEHVAASGETPESLLDPVIAPKLTLEAVVSSSEGSAMEKQSEYVATRSAKRKQVKHMAAVLDVPPQTKSPRTKKRKSKQNPL